MALVDDDFNHSEHGSEEGFCTPLRCVVETQEGQIHEVELLSTPIDSVVDEFNHLEEGFCTPLRCVVENEEGQVEDKLNDPEVGMVFSSWEEADKFWRQYGKQRGFGVLRAAGNYKTENGRSDKTKLRSYIWRCECAGQPDIRRKVNGKRVYGGGLSLQLNRRKTKKCGCLVQMRAACKQDGSWEVKKAVVVHVNHNPTPRKSRYISMFRQGEINSVVKRKLFNDCSAGSKVTQVHRNLAKERGGVENMAITERDLRNVLAKEKKFKMSGGDANAMLAYFDKMSADNQNFFHKYRVDDEGRLTDVMWVDARSRVAYEEFGDVVCFDSTYITNEYKLPFSNFVGVNHHGQTILLGCALVSHEDTDTFVWLFNNWKECMSGKVPGGFLTDQCPTMRKALSIVMPGAKHRRCLWHILNNFGTKLGKYSKYEEFHDVLLNVIYDSLTEEEFEVNWTLAMESYGLANDDWLTVLYDERHMWIPAYMKHLFWAGMKTTQRS
ncbi:protein FAR-RED IMPAIRED RESPONSE 1-like isoform X2 [Chenopodium quinoa]|uniref:protein FAR-RED IMPAIRED RESPONSE 1-like isoform X2 n=1 Tax=Chenopodium quinoa TaxID=63459 RepID=UPI000B771795|nr:protein FAR-RED IMPAIRED RESPONSE 1-like isoform X2 [Chenopodium quinoa]